MNGQASGSLLTFAGGIYRPIPITVSGKSITKSFGRRSRRSRKSRRSKRKNKSKRRSRRLRSRRRK